MKTYVIAMCLLALMGAAQAKDITVDIPSQNGSSEAEEKAFVANEQGVEQVFKAFFADTNLSVVLSAKAKRYRVSGNFLLEAPFKELTTLSNKLGLIWYFDGQVIYIYDATEIKSSVVSVSRTSLKSLTGFLRSAALYDERYPLRGDDTSRTFYISGPPKYIDIITSSASFLDEVAISEEENGSEEKYKHEEVIEAIKLSHSFVSDREYEQRSKKVINPGMASLIKELLADQGIATDIQVQATPLPVIHERDASLEDAEVSVRPAPSEKTPEPVRSTGSVKVVAYNNTNSLVVRGPRQQVRLVKDLVGALDVPRRQLELSLWIIDVSKADLDELGVDWSGQLSNTGAVGINLNRFETAMGNEQTARFLGEVSAMSRAGKAHVVARPLLLTQENTEALFDNNRSFYVQLTGERVAELQTITYGTSINVLPRVSQDDRQIEMDLNIEDGAATQGAGSDVAGLPVVNRTQINTVARVEREQSLLIGGYTRDELQEDDRRVPGLSNLPFIGGLFRFDRQRQNQQVRMFLIQPRLLLADRSLALSPSIKRPGLPLDNAVDQLKHYLEKNNGS
ncbi:type III secretion system outer membrane ring subunit SctC [Pseudomonas batumici]|uniref:type III secretion system outer membrane ring subunit SctC n=1 Tax=Pseudomonas batumici TaxID=226910 RepID=UPI0030D39370